MSSTRSKGKVSEPQVEIVTKLDDVNNGKPCIDFQPDDRWQIKEDKGTSKNVENPKNKDAAFSNGRHARRLRSSKSDDSSLANGKADESSSDTDNLNVTRNELSSKDSEELSDTSETEKTNSQQKRPHPESELDDGQDSKKKKIDDGTASDIADVKSAECDKDSNSNSQDDPNAPVSASECDKESNKNGIDLDSSIEVIPETTSASDVGQNLSDDSSKEEDDCEILPQSKDLEKPTSQSQSKVAETDKSIDDDIEIININEDGKNSDEESDSEIQIINQEDSKTRPSTEFTSITDFPSVSSTDTDITLAAGYPYYNSLKEKIPGFKAGDYKPVKFPHTGTLLLGENEVIIESPSLLVPLLIKESDTFPKTEGEEKKSTEGNPVVTKPSIISKRNFFQSSVGQFLINLGTSRVQEWYHRDMKRVKLKQLKSNKPTEEDIKKSVAYHEKRHGELKEINAIFNFRMRHCKHCDFKTESQCVLEGHYLTPHMSSRREYKCNFCTFLARDPTAIVFHVEALHRKKAVLEATMPFNECIFCSFSSNLKTKVSVHMNRCRKQFIPSQHLSPPYDFDFPGVTTKPVTIADVIGHRRLLLSSAKNRMPEDNSANSAYARKKLASVLTKLSGQAAYGDIKNPNLMKHLMTGQSHLAPLTAGSTIQLPPGIVITRPRGGGPIQQMRPIGRFPQPRSLQAIRGVPPRRPFATTLKTAASQLASSGISITPITRTPVMPRTNTVTGIRNVTLTPISTASNRTVSPKPGPPQPVALYTNMAGSSTLVGQPQARMPSLKPLRPAVPYQRLNTPPSQVIKVLNDNSGNTFVVCEICDSYIKDLEELRTHMNWVHKVKIHPKMLVSRPPLNCQKCQWRFFTDQGLERHLLGAHGLVTTNMQEMANKNQDGGRCIICGAVFTYKLVSHMTHVHKVTLKPAHLSYKCTVCTATFTLYRLFESHVYNVHSGSAKRAAEESSSEPPAKKPAEDSAPRRCKDCNFVTENMHEHLIKKHMKNCSVKLCRIEKCKKCLYSSDEMLLIRMSDFGLDEDLDDDSSGEDDSSDESSEDDEVKKESG